MIGPLDLHLIGEGTHERLWDVLGAHVLQGNVDQDRVDQPAPRSTDRAGTDQADPDLPVTGVHFGVWAPNAKAVGVAGDWNRWQGSSDPLRRHPESGVWETNVADARPGHRYKYEIVGDDGHIRLKADPLAVAAEAPPGTASVVHRTRHRWSEGAQRWLEQRAASDPLDARMAVYEAHLGSWRRPPGTPDGHNRYLGYAELAQQLADHALGLGFTHVELLPPTEHPYDPSWGYQVSSYFAPSARFGDPDGFRAFVDHLHSRGLGVLVDWVPAHFPRDDWALARFDGAPLYEHHDPRRAEHPDWGTLVFDLERPEVRNFLIAAARYWFEEMHVDGLRVDAVASMLYLDYSRSEGQWVPNEQGGRENLDAVSLFQELNTVVHRDYPGVVTVAEESTAWDGVTRPAHYGGLGFSQKWNMGWMHDTLGFFREHPDQRRWHRDKLTFGLTYAWSENFVLPLSHDEVVHGKGSLVGKMPGEREQQLANLRALYAWMWAHPGKKLLFMGGELAQVREWSHDRELDWWLLDDPGHSGMRDLVRELNRVAADHPALWAGDTRPEGFAWIDPDSLAFMRRLDGADTEPVVVVANLSAVPHHGYRVGLPSTARWRDVLNTDEVRWGGRGLTQPEVATDGVAAAAGGTGRALPWQGQPDSAVLTLPALTVRWLVAAPSPGRGG